MTTPILGTLLWYASEFGPVLFGMTGEYPLALRDTDPPDPLTLVKRFDWIDRITSEVYNHLPNHFKTPFLCPKDGCEMFYRSFYETSGKHRTMTKSWANVFTCPHCGLLTSFPRPAESSHHILRAFALREAAQDTFLAAENGFYAAERFPE